jgi:hypothetical protein
MRRIKLIAAGAVALVGLSACNNPDAARGGGSARVCTPFPEAASTNNANGQAAAPAQPTDPAGVLDDCLHRWGYTLAASSDPAEAVAQATVAACTQALTRWNQQGLAMGAAPQQPGEQVQEAPSLVNGQPTNPFAEHFGFAQSRALFYVVQARAGKCAAPSTLTPNTAAASPPATGAPLQR